MKHFFRFWLIIIFAFWASPLISQSTDFRFIGQVVKPGKAVSFDVPIVAGSDTTFLPFTVIHGSKPGPVLGLIAGIHGYEYPPIIAMQKFPAEVDAKGLTGTVIILHIANVPAFQGRTVYYNPVDGKNLNRQFPGNARGTLSEVIAWYISNKVIPICQYVVDIHAGDASEDLHDYTAWYEYKTQTETARKMAVALGFEWTLRSPLILLPDQPTIYCTKEAASRNIPTVAIECGRSGVVESFQIEKINSGLKNMMRMLGMISGQYVKQQEPIELARRITLNAEVSGIFYSEFKSGDLIKKGRVIATITNYSGQKLQDIIAPSDGIIIYKLSTPPVNKGEIVFSLGELKFD